MLPDLAWRLLFLACWLALFVIRWPHVTVSKREVVTERRVDLQETVLLAMMGLAWMLLPQVWLWTPLFARADYPAPEAVRWIGLAVAIAAIWLFWRSHADLGRQWSTTLELRAEHQLVDHGVYRRIRHPMYAAIWLWALAQALLIPNFVVGPAILVAFTFMYALRTPREEQMMLEKFGDAYAEYMKRTGRILPRFR